MLARRAIGRVRDLVAGRSNHAGRSRRDCPTLAEGVQHRPFHSAAGQMGRDPAANDVAAGFHPSGRDRGRRRAATTGPARHRGSRYARASVNGCALHSWTRRSPADNAMRYSVVPGAGPGPSSRLRLLCCLGVWVAGSVHSLSSVIEFSRRLVDRDCVGRTIYPRPTS